MGGAFRQTNAWRPSKMFAATVVVVMLTLASVTNSKNDADGLEQDSVEQQRNASVSRETHRYSDHSLDQAARQEGIRRHVGLSAKWWTLYPLCLSVCPYVGPSVGNTLLFGSVALPKCLTNLYHHYPCPPTSNLGSRISGLDGRVLAFYMRECCLWVGRQVRTSTL